MRKPSLSRRDLFRGGRDVGGLLALSALLQTKTELGVSYLDAAQTVARTAPDVYGSIGVRPRTTERAGADSLTPSERRVVELAATGDTNRQIAQTLFVTEKTVETHMGRAFRKLEVSSRRQLPDALAGVVG